MRRYDWSWAYWGLFGLGLTAVAWLGGLVLWRLRTAYEQDALTRHTLLDVLVLSLALLVCLLVACWAYASRPTPSERDVDPLWA